MTFVHSQTIACWRSTSFLHVRWTSKSVAHPTFSESTDLEVHRTTAAEATHRLSPNACTDDRLLAVPFISARTMDFQVRRPSDVF